MSTIHALDNTVFDLPMEEGVDPAAGASYAVLLPANCRTQIMSVSFRWESSGAAANRYLRLQVDSGGVPLWYSNYIPAIILNQVLYFSFIAGGPPSPLIAPPGVYIEVGFGQGLVNDAQQTVRINVVNIQGADQISDVWIQYRRWPLPVYVY